MRTTPDDFVPEPYDETAIQSIAALILSSREKSAMTMTAPFSTPTSSGSRPAVASTWRATSAIFAWICSSV
jgi:hypothetical protein